MITLVDTSALYALVVRSDQHHSRAAVAFRGLVDESALVTHNYVDVEIISLVHARHGRASVAAVRSLLDVIEHVWVDHELHARAFDELADPGADHGRDGPSFVDLVSFAVMDEHGISRAFAYNDAFARRGFELVN